MNEAKDVNGAATEGRLKSIVSQVIQSEDKVRLRGVNRVQECTTLLFTQTVNAHLQHHSGHTKHYWLSSLTIFCSPLCSSPLSITILYDLAFSLQNTLDFSLPPYPSLRMPSLRVSFPPPLALSFFGRRKPIKGSGPVLL